ncbi:MAG: CCA tRNA nucleotidyltransferase [Alphaproteobacteria bacterium]|nr:CCA tRNA nucleotidyltransferase [Alphaproteobacteria bacterium]MCY4320455.1 CCA tRNA nucleotidyltransferase [Alphaproteobacteria bacterium]
MSTFAPAADWMREPDIARIVGALGACRFVGGAVRDALAERAVHDIDIATPEEPPEVVRRLEVAGLKLRTHGISHGVVLAIGETRICEVASLRRDAKTDGRYATVAWTRDWHEDAARRDFTVNAMSASPGGGLFDYFGGRADLAAGVIRFVGDPEMRIREDVLRVLRFFRFTARFGTLPGHTASLDAAIGLAPMMKKLSGERLRAEMLGLLAAPDPTPVVALMVARRVFHLILPAAERMDRLARTVAAEARLGMMPDPVRRLAALLARPDPGRLRLSAAEKARLEALAAPKPLDRATLCREGRARFLDHLLLAGGDGAGEALLAESPPPRFPLSGADLRKRGMPPGPALGRLLRDLEDWWIAKSFHPDRLACLAELERRLG